MMTPGSANALLLADAGYQVQRSVRLRSSASAYLNRTQGAGNRRIFTLSEWVKRGSLGSYNPLFTVQNDLTNSDWDTLEFNSSDVLRFYLNGASSGYFVTTQVFRDPSAWYHIVVAVDTTQATSTNRVKIYVNGLQITSFTTATYPSQNFDCWINKSGRVAALGANYYSAPTGYFDGYLTDINFIDGQALTPASFGEINPVTGVWSAKKYAGTYGTNGFFLNFSDNSAATAAAIGKDSSGNGNNWTPNNISVTAGVTYDSMLDVPLGAGGAERGNYAVLNPLVQRWSQPNIVFSEANLKATVSTAVNSYCLGTFFPTSGKWYWETTVVSVGGASGVADTQLQNTVFSNSAFYYPNGTKDVANVNSAYGATYTTNDVIGVALDCDGSTVTFYKNNASQGAITLPSGSVGLGAALYLSNNVFAANFGQRPFAYTPPTGFKALHTGNLPEPVIKQGASYMAATTYTGNGGTQSVTNSGGFQPDFAWVKGRNVVTEHVLMDAVRGAGRLLRSNATAAEAGNAGDLVTSFNSGGITVNNTYLGAANGSTNGSSSTYVAWQWKANGAAVSNTAGSITSQVSAGVSQGFSVVTYTGTGANATVGHGLGVAPSMIIFKRRNSTSNWAVYHKNLTSAAYTIYLDLTNGQSLFAADFNSTAPTSSVFSVGTSTNTGSANTFVAYCFSEVAGYSKFGSYTGNGSADGPFVFCGFRPRFVMVKRTDTTGNWYLIDTARSASNLAANVLGPNLSAAEPAFTTEFNEDILSNGFKLRVANVESNANGGTYIFAAFAEHPFKNSLAR